MYTITTLITSYNHEKYIEECLESVIRQKGDFQHEIIVADDYSKDNTRKIIKKYTSKYRNFVKSMPSFSNVGLVKNMKRAFSSIYSDFIAICEGDDYWIDDQKLQKQLNFLLENPDLSMCFTKLLLKTQTSDDLVEHSSQKKLTNKIVTFNDFLEADPANFSCCFYRRSTIDLVSKRYYTEENGKVADWLFNLCILNHSNIGYLNEPLVVYRLHDKGQWTGLSPEEKNKRIQESYKLFLDYFPDRKEVIQDYVLRNSLMKNNQKKSLKVIKKNQRVPVNFLNRIRNREEIVKIQTQKQRNNFLEKCKAINVGCGNQPFDEPWLNVDFDFKNIKNFLKLDVTSSFPFKDVEIIYCEHFIEHLTKEQGIAFIKNCHKSLIRGCVLRIATFDLDELVDNSHSMNENWKEYCEADRLGLGHMSKCQYLNAAFREWGHQYVYNQEDLIDIFKKGGFTNIKVCDINVSEIPMLCNRESRFNSRLVIEGHK